MEDRVERSAFEGNLGVAVGTDGTRTGGVEMNADGLSVERAEVETDEMADAREVHQGVGALRPEGGVIAGIDGLKVDRVNGAPGGVLNAD